MEGYMTGAINYSTEFTLVWAAKIVGKASHYNDFTADRNAILDRYLETYGPGWFFYEAPLKINPDGKPRLGGSVGLQRGNGNFALQLYNINQGFWKQSGFVSRLSRETLGPTQMRDGGPQFIRDEQGRVDCGSPGPKLTFRSLLDSGATYPTLHAEDLIALGIDIFWYPAQSVQTMTTANGSINSRLYELFVCVLDEQGRQLVDPKDAVWPYSHKYLGGLCPVAASTIPMQYDENGLERPFRLSGILPFLACYISSTPGRNTLFLGEDRNDVLGTHRMPGQKKWVIQMPPLQLASSIPFEAYGNPHVMFSHRGGQIVDIDRRDKKHASTLIFMPGTAEEEVIENDPGSAQHAARAKMGAGIEAHGLEEEDVTVNPAPINRLYPNDFII